MGFGDFKLLAAIGAWCGWQVLPLTILLSSFIGAAVGIALMVFARHGRSVPIPFGPYLGAAGSVALFWGPQITRQYLNQFMRSEEHTSELQSRLHLVCRLLLEKKKNTH